MIVGGVLAPTRFVTSKIMMGTTPKSALVRHVAACSHTRRQHVRRATTARYITAPDKASVTFEKRDIEADGPR
jgi:hypothetical protein